MCTRATGTICWATRRRIYGELGWCWSNWASSKKYSISRVFPSPPQIVHRSDCLLPREGVEHFHGCRLCGGVSAADAAGAGHHPVFRAVSAGRANEHTHKCTCTLNLCSLLFDFLRFIRLCSDSVSLPMIGCISSIQPFSSVHNLSPLPLFHLTNETNPSLCTCRIVRFLSPHKNMHVCVCFVFRPPWRTVKYRIA